MNWNTWIRQGHRWLSIAFTVTVVANLVVREECYVGLSHAR
jgi:hypothetical protein